jgi:fused signal recognition particle receptor
MGVFSVFSRNKKESLDKGLEKTRENLLGKISRTLIGKSKVDDDVLDELEEILVTSDVGVETTIRIIERIQERVSKDKYLGASQLNTILKEEIAGLLEDHELLDINTIGLTEDGSPYVILVVGVNGVGKTTTIGKLAHQFKAAGKQVVLGAADTFRAAAIDQLKIWADRVDVPLVQQKMGSDPASVAYDTVAAAKSQGADIAIIDTAGRLHNKTNLMNELGKIKRVMQKVIPNAPHEVLLVLDGSTGQNAVEQAKQFTAFTEVTSLAITKLDGTAKGGVVLGISDQFKIPVKYIGVGEKIDDLQLFDRKAFVESLFGE